MNAELQELLPAILAPKVGLAPPLDSADGAGAALAAAAAAPWASVSPSCWPGTVDPSVPQPVPQTPSATWVQGAAACAVATALREPSGCVTILLANKASEPLPIVLSLPSSYGGATLEHVFRHSSHNLSAAAELTTTLGPLETMALQHGCYTPPPKAPEHPKNLVANGGMWIAQGDTVILNCLWMSLTVTP